MKKKTFSTNFLLPKNNFFIGMGSVLNLGGNYFNYKTSNSEVEADKKALFSDWWNVGNDIDSILKNTLKDKYSKKF
ncbi:MAG: hypothetical protein KA734_07615 [Fluviicola sp.]|nr:hypothetical protein [Fluviicola sp.]